MKLLIANLTIFIIILTLNSTFSRIIKIRMTKKDSYIRGLSLGNKKIKHKNSKIQKKSKNNLNPLSLEIGLHKYNQCIILK